MMIIKLWLMFITIFHAIRYIDNLAVLSCEGKSAVGSKEMVFYTILLTADWYIFMMGIN